MFLVYLRPVHFSFNWIFLLETTLIKQAVIKYFFLDAKYHNEIQAKINLALVGLLSIFEIIKTQDHWQKNNKLVYFFIF